MQVLLGGLLDLCIDAQLTVARALAVGKVDDDFQPVAHQPPSPRNCEPLSMALSHSFTNKPGLFAGADVALRHRFSYS
jgi:hypothetical protein